MSDVSTSWTAALTASGWSGRDLWLACFALGADTTRDELDRFLLGQSEPSAAEYNVIAQALNERFSDLGFDRPLPYKDRS